MGEGVRREVRRNVKLQGWSSLTALPVVIEVKYRQDSSAHDSVLVHLCCGSLY